MTQAKNHAYGMDDHPAFTNQLALHGLVEKYELQIKLERTLNSLLTKAQVEQPEHVAER